MRDTKKDKKDQRLPKFRHTGIMLDVEMHYTNRQPGQVIIHQPDVSKPISQLPSSRPLTLPPSQGSTPPW